MPRLALIANPAASGFTASLHHLVSATLRDSYEVTAIWPEGAEAAERAAAEAAGDGVDVVVAMGGDGIVHRVANGLSGSRSALGLIPAGTTNVFARLMGVPRRPTRAAAALAAASGTKQVTTVEVRAGDRSPRSAVFAAGVGFDADMIVESDKKPLRKVGLGPVHYARSGIRVALSSYRDDPPQISVDVDGEVESAVSALVQVHGAFSYIGRRALRLSRAPGPAVVALDRASPMHLIRNLMAAAGRGLQRRSGPRVWTGFDRVRVTMAEPIGCEIDGEYFGKVTSLTAEPRPHSLMVVDL